MKLYELAYACRLYQSQYDPAYREMRNALGEHPTLDSEAQRGALLRFLNEWGCRIPESPTLKDRIREWAAVWVPQLPGAARDIGSLNDAELTLIGNAYDQLLKLGAGLHFQDTAAAKTLHALRIRLLPMWDAAIMNRFRQRGSSNRTGGQTYADFIRDVAEQISELEADAARLGYSLAEVADLVQGCNGPLVKLVDEYNWVTITGKHAIPTSEDLERWLSWVARP
jgi:hypothetical protein